MKLLGIIASLAGAVLFLQGQALAAPLMSTTVDPSYLEVSVLGGNTFKLNQVANEEYSMRHRGPKSLAKTYAKFDAALPGDLLALLEELFGQPGLNSSTGTGWNSSASEGT